MECSRQNAIHAINRKGNSILLAQYQSRDKFWLEVAHLKLLYQMIKLAPKRYSPLVITKEISPLAYQLALPHSWKIYNMFYASLLLAYREMPLYGPNYS